MSNILEYREIIERFARDRTNQRVPNGLPQHASVLLETMFKHATAEMRIYTGELNEAVFGQPAMISAVASFLSKPYASMKILLQKEKDDSWVDSHPLIQAISKIQAPHGRTEIRCAQGVYATEAANHFAVMDNDAYRYELDHGACKAVANFNEPRVAEQLLSVFDKAFDLAAATLSPVKFN